MTAENIWNIIDFVSTVNRNSLGLGVRSTEFEKETSGCGEKEGESRTSVREYEMYSIQNVSVALAFSS